MRPLLVTFALLTFLSVDAYAKDKDKKKGKETTTTTETTTVETTTTAPDAAAPADGTTPVATTTTMTTTTTTTVDCTTLTGDAKTECEKTAAATAEATKSGKSMQKSDDGKLEAVEDE